MGPPEQEGREGGSGEGGQGDLNENQESEHGSGYGEDYSSVAQGMLGLAGDDSDSDE